MPIIAKPKNTQAKDRVYSGVCTSLGFTVPQKCGHARAVRQAGIAGMLGGTHARMHIW